MPRERFGEPPARRGAIIRYDALNFPEMVPQTDRSEFDEFLKLDPTEPT
jgi:hypothetical protein